MCVCMVCVGVVWVYMCVCVCVLVVCVCACVRAACLCACVRVCARVCVHACVCGVYTCVYARVCARACDQPAKSGKAMEIKVTRTLQTLAKLSQTTPSYPALHPRYVST